jgi:hypothetical protein
MPANRVSPGQLENFLQRYDRVQAAHKSTFACEFAEELDRFRPQFEKAERQRNIKWRQQAPDFNVFKVLGVQEKEAIHSRFLGDLLDPHGAHRQGKLFLREFLQICGYKANVSPWIDEIIIRPEATIFGGRCDLLIEAPRRLCVIVENKINAPEGDKQLLNYYKYLDPDLHPAEFRRLVYLTPRGDAAKRLDAKHYIRLSYMTDVKRWLGKLRSDVRPRQVRSVIDQYIAVISAWGDNDEDT